MYRIAIAALALLQASAAMAGIGSLRQRWPQDRAITICFFGGSHLSRAKISDIARAWINDTSVSFDFGRPPQFNSCTGSASFDVRVGFQDGGSWSYVGTDARLVNSDQPTINFKGLEESVRPEHRKIILEEFGHVLGILHGEQDPQANCRAELNLEYFKGLGLSEADIEARYFPPRIGRQVASNDGDYISTGLDNQSVMRLFTRPEFFKERSKNRCYGPSTDTLSAGDLKLVRLLYPKKPSDVDASKPQHLTVRFEGALAAEHFGYVLSALYDSGRISLR
jgi:hypothetical protein